MDGWMDTHVAGRKTSDVVHSFDFVVDERRDSFIIRIHLPHSFEYQRVLLLAGRHSRFRACCGTKRKNFEYVCLQKGVDYRRCFVGHTSWRLLSTRITVPSTSFMVNWRYRFGSWICNDEYKGSDSFHCVLAVWDWPQHCNSAQLPSSVSRVGRLEIGDRHEVEEINCSSYTFRLLLLIPCFAAHRLVKPFFYFHYYYCLRSTRSYQSITLISIASEKLYCRRHDEFLRSYGMRAINSLATPLTLQYINFWDCHLHNKSISEYSAHRDSWNALVV